AEGQAVAAGELRRGISAALELIDHLALDELDAAERDREPELGRLELNLKLADADLPSERVGAAVAALRGVGEPKEAPLVGAGERLQPLGAGHREDGGLPGEVTWFRVAIILGLVGLDERARAKQVGHARHRRNFRYALSRVVGLRGFFSGGTGGRPSGRCLRL